MREQVRGALAQGSKAMSGARPGAQQGHAGDCEQRPLVPRSRCPPRLKRSVDMTSDVKSREQLFLCLPPFFLFSLSHWKRRSQ
jgi:hypothetical protein